jgi:hypothetical protein
MPKRVFVLQPRPHPARRNAAEFILNAAPDGFAVTVAEPTRTLEQNARMWALLTDISEQVEWYGKRLTPEDWKHLFSAVLKDQRTVPGINGGFVVMGVSTSRMSKRELGDLMELIAAFGSERGVVWSEPEMEMA